MIKRKIKEQVFNRDGGICKKCGSKENLTIDHIKPISEGGTGHFDNLQTLCASCNRKKSNFYKTNLWGKLVQFWRLSDIIVTLKNDIRTTQSIIHGYVKKIDEPKIEIHQRFEKMKEYIAKIETERLTDRKKIHELESKFQALTTYLKVEYINEARFIKISKK